MLGPMARKALVTVHLIVNGVWLGLVVACLALLLDVDDAHPAGAFAAFALHDTLVIWASLIVVVTGALFSLFTPWGLVKFWWVALKWAGLAVLGVLTPFVVAARLAEVVAAADVARATGAPFAAYEARDGAVAWLVVVLALLVGLFALSVWRPPAKTGLALEEKPFVRPVVVIVLVVVSTLTLVQVAVLEAARRAPIPHPDARGVADGRHLAAIDWIGVPVEVAVTVAGERVVDLEIVDGPSGAYPELARGVIEKVRAAGTLAVDGVSGATTSARAFLVAGGTALANAAGSAAP